MSPDLLERTVEFFRSDLTRGALIFGFGLGLTAGFALGFLFSRHCFAFVVWYFRSRRADREAERQRREDAAQRRLESCRKRHEAEARRVFIAARIERGVTCKGALCTDRDGRIYCPDCFDREQLVEVREAATGFICPECGREI